MDAIHFRHRAACAREMAQYGDDVRLSRMLLEVALDLDAEAEAIEAGGDTDRRCSHRVGQPAVYGSRLHLVGLETDPTPVDLIDLSIGGAKFHIDQTLTPGSKVILELPHQAFQLCGTIVRVRGAEVAMVFEPAVSADPALRRLLQSDARLGLARP